MALSSTFASSWRGIGNGQTLKKLTDQAHDVLLANWHLGLTAFGGPSVHFQIYQELFAIANALPGPGSTKMLFNINVLRGGFLAGVVGFLIWSLPGAIGMFGFALGVSNIGEKLPKAVYALLSGINAATVGIIALAAVQLSQKVITDKFTRVLVFLGGTAGMLYSALWYFPVLLATAGLATIIWDRRVIQNLAKSLTTRERRVQDTTELSESPLATANVSSTPAAPSSSTTTSAQHGPTTPTTSHLRDTRQTDPPKSTPPTQEPNPDPNPSLGTPLPPPRNPSIITWRLGLLLLIAFFTSFVPIMVIRNLHHSPHRAFSVFANLYLAGTIIFGGGPVVIPLLREYVVAEGWVTPRNFLLGLALIQAFPGPNFNFAVYLGALAVGGTGTSPVVGAVVAYVGIFLPGLVVQTGFMGIWGTLRKNRELVSALRGINAVAVGLVFTAVYRLWQIGFLDERNQSGMPLGGSPWWVVVVATSFVGGMWFGVNPAGCVVVGGVMGMVWYGVVQS